MEQDEDVLAASPPTMHTAHSFGLPSPERCLSPNTALETGAPGDHTTETTLIVAQYEARLAAKHNELLQLKRRLQVWH